MGDKRIFCYTGYQSIALILRTIWETRILSIKKLPQKGLFEAMLNTKFVFLMIFQKEKDISF
jgi:hypothetical protein